MGGELRADGIGETDMGDQAFAEEGGDAAAGAIDELIGDDEIERAMFFLERADGAEGEDAFDAERLQAPDIGAKIQLRRRDAMAAAVAGEEGDFPARERADDVGIRRRAPGCFDGDFALPFEAGHGIKPAASDDSDGW